MLSVISTEHFTFWGSFTSTDIDFIMYLIQTANLLSQVKTTTAALRNWDSSFLFHYSYPSLVSVLTPALSERKHT